MRSWRAWVGIGVVGGCAAFGQRIDAGAGWRNLEAAAPGVEALRDARGRVERAYGVGMSFGPTARASAEAFLTQHAAVFGTAKADLVAEGLPAGLSAEQPLMTAADGSAKFSLFTYRQKRGGLAVYDADLRVLVRNLADHPTVLVASNLRELGDWQPPAGVTPRPVAEIAAEVAPEFELEDGSEQVIFAGTADQPADPRVAVTFVVRQGADWAPDHARERIVADAQTGALLHRENLVVHADITGTVSARMTQDYNSSACNPLITRPMPYARIESEAGVTFANALGDYTISTALVTPLNVTSQVRGQYFNVNNQAGADASLSTALTAPGTANFIHNNTATTEFTTAQTDAYWHANIVRDFVLGIQPSYPVIGTQVDFSVNVNINDVCNANYNGTSINFFRAGGGCNNTVIPDVVYHEYGHHLVQVGGSGQGQYGEGMSDTVGMLITGEPELGIGFETCSAGIRNAINTLTYPCGSAIHFCGQLISGAVWETWQELNASDPVTAEAVIRDLTINSIPLHTGTQITPAIYLDFLTLDDDDADLGNGTPHEPEITAGFAVKNLVPQPPPENDGIGGAVTVCSGESYMGSTSWATNDGSAGCGTSTTSADVWYRFEAAANGSLTASLCGAGTSYDSVVSIHSGAPGTSGNQLACDDDGCGTGGGPSVASAAVTAGSTYYIRVSGWSGSSGPFTLNVTGPECAIDAAVSIGLPSGAPTHVAPQGAAVFAVQIDDGTEAYAAGTGVLRYRTAGATEFSSAALAELGGNQFEASLPGGDCGESIEFYIEAEGDLGGVATFPFTAPTQLLTAAVGVEQVALADTFETDQGWTATSTAGTADGFWERGIPVNDPAWAYDPPADADGSGRCYLTRNVAGNTDVDSGTVTLMSPAFDLSAGDATIEYEYYLRLSDSSGGDRLLVEVSSSGDAGPWTQVALHSSDLGTVWQHHSISPAALATAGVTLTADMRVRFSANDANPQSIVEAGVDVVRISRTECVQPDCPGDTDGDQDVDLDDLLVVLGSFGQAGPGLAGDVDGDDDVDLDDLLVVLAVFGAPCGV